MTKQADRGALTDRGQRDGLSHDLDRNVLTVSDERSGTRQAEYQTYMLERPTGTLPASGAPR